MSNLYNTSIIDSEHHFSSDTGDKYVVYFIESKIYQKSQFGQREEVKIYHIGFSRDKNYNSVIRFDRKVRDTILSIYMNFIEAHPDDAFIYICDNDDRRGRHRSITFGSWFNDYKPSTPLFRCNFNSSETTLYVSLVMVSSNPLKHFYMDAFEYTLKDLYNNE